jgi:hypothetical protein
MAPAGFVAASLSTIEHFADGWWTTQKSPASAGVTRAASTIALANDFSIGHLFGLCPQQQFSELPAQQNAALSRATFCRAVPARACSARVSPLALSFQPDTHLSCHGHNVTARNFRRLGLL